MNEGRTAPSHRLGFTAVEMIVVLVLAGILVGIAAPPLGRMRTRAALQNARAAVTSALTVARSASTQWGRTSILRIDAYGDALWTVVDTGSAGTGADTVVLGRFLLRDDFGVNLRSERTALCFNSRGVGTAATECPTLGAQLVLEHGGESDTLFINAAGRLWR